jgi:predicted AAA+ superfamily ATPase
MATLVCGTIVERDFPALGNSLGATGYTIRHYLDLLEGTCHVRLLVPWQKNQGKRLVKTPKAFWTAVADLSPTCRRL